MRSERLTERNHIFLVNITGVIFFFCLCQKKKLKLMLPTLVTFPHSRIGQNVVSLVEKPPFQKQQISVFLYLCFLFAAIYGQKRDAKLVG